MLKGQVSSVARADVINAHASQRCSVQQLPAAAIVASGVEVQLPRDLLRVHALTNGVAFASFDIRKYVDRILSYSRLRSIAHLDERRPIADATPALKSPHWGSP